MQTYWAAQLNPILALPISRGLILSKVALVSGSNTINHLLSRKLQGWFLVRQRASATIYDTQDSNLSPEITLLLTASGNVTVDIFVF